MKTIIFYLVLAVVIVRFDVIGLASEKISAAQSGLDQFNSYHQKH